MRVLIGVLVGFAIAVLINVAIAEAAYRPAVAVQDEGAISCGNPEERHKALEVARQMHATTVRINAIENMNPVFGCDPIGAVRAVEAAGFSPYVTIVGSPRYARYLARTVGSLVDTWGIWNEITIPGWRIGHMKHYAGPEDYRKLAVRMLRVLRRHDRTGKVLLGEIPPGGNHDLWFMSKVAPKGKKALRVDGVALHAYRWTGSPEVNTSSEHLDGYLREWNRVLRRWARERRLCRPVTRLVQARSCRPVPIYITESGFLRRSTTRDAPVFDTPTVADLYVRSWRVACQAKVRTMLHYQLIEQPQEWDTALVSRWGPRPEFSALAGYLDRVQGCRGRAGALGAVHGPPLPVFVPDHPVSAAPVLGREPEDVYDVPPDVPILVEPDPPRVEPDPVVEEPAVVEPTPEPPVQDPEPPLNDPAEVPMN